MQKKISHLKKENAKKTQVLKKKKKNTEKPICNREKTGNERLIAQGTLQGKVHSQKAPSTPSICSLPCQSKVGLVWPTKHLRGFTASNDQRSRGAVLMCKIN